MLHITPYAECRYTECCYAECRDAMDLIVYIKNFILQEQYISIDLPIIPKMSVHLWVTPYDTSTSS